MRDLGPQPRRTNFGFNAALAAPDKASGLDRGRASSGAPPETANLVALKDVPQLIVWGDFVAQSELWTKLIRGLDDDYHKRAGGHGRQGRLGLAARQGHQGQRPYAG